MTTILFPKCKARSSKPVGFKSKVFGSHVAVKLPKPLYLAFIHLLIPLRQSTTKNHVQGMRVYKLWKDLCLFCSFVSRDYDRLYILEESVENGRI